MLVLLVEDETDLAELVIDYLETEDIECDYAADGLMAASLIEQNQYDVIILDVTMPKLDGFSLCRQLQQKGITTPIIFVTVRDQLDDKLTGFELGADDYLTKPFELDELVARLKVLANRKHAVQPHFELDDLVIDYDLREVRRSEQLLALSPTQWQLLTLLAKYSPQVVDKVTIEDHIWPDQEANKDMLKTLVFRLRSIVDGPEQKTLLHTIRGAGICLRLLDE